MRKAVSIVVVAVLVGVFLDALLGPDETIAQRDMTAENETPFYGLHVALPPGHEEFPGGIGSTAVTERAVNDWPADRASPTGARSHFR